MINVRLGSEREEYVEGKLRAGAFSSAEDMVDEALREDLTALPLRFWKVYS